MLGNEYMQPAHLAPHPQAHLSRNAAWKAAGVNDGQQSNAAVAVVRHHVPHGVQGAEDADRVQLSVAMTLQDRDIIVSISGQDRSAKALLRSKRPVAAAYTRLCGGHNGVAPGEFRPTTALWPHTVQLSECRAHLVASQPVCILTTAPHSLPRLCGSVDCVPLQRPSLHRQWTHFLTTTVQQDDSQLSHGQVECAGPSHKQDCKAEKPKWGQRCQPTNCFTEATARSNHLLLQASSCRTSKDFLYVMCMCTHDCGRKL